MKIFVSIVSYRDPLLHQTLRNMMEMQSQLTKITYGIFEQTDYADSLEAKYPDLAQNRWVDWWLAHGTVVLFFPRSPINLIKNLIDDTNGMVGGYGIVERSWD